MGAEYEKTKSGYLVSVPKEREDDFHRTFPKAKRKGERWQVAAKLGDKLEAWAGEAPAAPTQPESVETSDIGKLESQLERAGPDLVRRRILNRQRDNLLAERARR